ncbi:MAG: DUF3189 family protein [Bacillota bacterium]|jgi:hypothetical protein|nr:DUF3189 family protein [Clostridia bacterium]
MKIIFYSYSGVHSAVVAGAAYLGLWSAQEAASLQFSGIPFFGCQESKSELRYLGNDKQGNQVYTLGVKGEMELVPRAIQDFLQLMEIPAQDLIMINTNLFINRMSRWGERLARYGLIKTGNFLARQGLKKDFPLLFKEVKKMLKRQGVLT